MAPKISIVLNSYNPSRYLHAAIASVLDQTYRDFELLVWDDGSTDDSLDIARSLVATDDRLHVMAAAHQGRGRALREAIANTSGEYIAWIDRDDILAPTALEKTVAILERRREVGMVYTDYLDVDDAGEVLGLGDRCQVPYSRDRLLTDFMTFHFRLMRREVYDRAGGIDPAFEYAEDYDLCLRLSEITEIHHLAEPLYHYRHHAENSSRSHALLQQARSQCAVNNALRRRGLHDTLQLQVRDGMFVLQPRPTASRSRVAAVLASLSLPLMPLPAIANPLPPDGTAIVERASQGVARSAETPLDAERLDDENAESDLSRDELDASFDAALKGAEDAPQVRSQERIGRGYGYGGNGYGYGRSGVPMRPIAQSDGRDPAPEYRIAPDGNIEFNG